MVDRRVRQISLGVIGAAAVIGAVNYIPDLLRPSPEVAVSQSEGQVVVSTSRWVLFKDRRLQDVLDKIEKECAGKISIEIPDNALVQQLAVKTDVETCAISLGNRIRLGKYDVKP